MTKLKFYTIKTIALVFLGFTTYKFIKFIFYDGFLDEVDIFIRSMTSINAFLRFILFVFIALLILSFLIILLLSITILIRTKRPKLTREIKEEINKYKIQREKERRDDEKRIQELPILQITLSTNEKISGKFEETDKCLINVNNGTKVFKKYIVKIEKI